MASAWPHLALRANQDETRTTPGERLPLSRRGRHADRHRAHARIRGRAGKAHRRLGQSGGKARGSAGPGERPDDRRPRSPLRAAQAQSERCPRIGVPLRRRPEASLDQGRGPSRRGLDRPFGSSRIVSPTVRREQALLLCGAFPCGAGACFTVAASRSNAFSPNGPTSASRSSTGHFVYDLKRPGIDKGAAIEHFMADRRSWAVVRFSSATT